MNLWTKQEVLLRLGRWPVAAPCWSQPKGLGLLYISLISRPTAPLVTDFQIRTDDSMAHSSSSSALPLSLALLRHLHFLLQAHDIHPLLLAALLQFLDAAFRPLDLLLNKVQPPVHRGHGVNLVLLQKDGANELVDIRGVRQCSEFGGDGLILSQLGFKSLAGGDGGLEVYRGMLLVWRRRGKYIGSHGEAWKRPRKTSDLSSSKVKTTLAACLAKLS